MGSGDRQVAAEQQSAAGGELRAVKFQARRSVVGRRKLKLAGIKCARAGRACVVLNNRSDWKDRTGVSNWHALEARTSVENVD